VHVCLVVFLPLRSRYGLSTCAEAEAGTRQRNGALQIARPRSVPSVKTVLRRTSRATFQLPSPLEAKSGLMQTDNRLRLNRIPSTFDHRDNFPQRVTENSRLNSWKTGALPVRFTCVGAPEIERPHWNRVTSAVYSSPCLRIEPQVPFLRASKLRETRCGFGFLFVRQGNLTVFHHGATVAEQSVYVRR
jgi:hypothetical protein